MFWWQLNPITLIAFISYRQPRDRIFCQTEIKFQGQELPMDTSRRLGGRRIPTIVWIWNKVGQINKTKCKDSPKWNFLDLCKLEHYIQKWNKVEGMHYPEVLSCKWPKWEHCHNCYPYPLIEGWENHGETLWKWKFYSSKGLKFCRTVPWISIKTPWIHGNFAEKPKHWLWCIKWPYCKELG